MTTYSHSRLTLFESCPEAYKIKYIDKTFPELPTSMSLFLGSMTHETLEWLYHKVRQKDVPTMDELLEHFILNWEVKYTPEIRMLNGTTMKGSFHKGLKFLIGYYKMYHPFSESTLEIEKRIVFSLDELGECKIQGFIDRLVLSPEGVYEVHDYKTNAKAKSQKEVDADRQLAFYHLGLKKIYGDDIRVKLIWHFLAHDLTVTSTRTEEQLEDLRVKTLGLIRKIETNTEWKACGSMWCDWCAYKKANSAPEDLTRPNRTLGEF